MTVLPGTRHSDWEGGREGERGERKGERKGRRESGREEEREGETQESIVHVHVNTPNYTIQKTRFLMGKEKGR